MRGSGTCPRRFWHVMLLAGGNRHSTSSHGFNGGSRALRRLNLIRWWQYRRTETIVRWNGSWIVWHWQWLQQSDQRHNFHYANTNEKFIDVERNTQFSMTKYYYYCLQYKCVISTTLPSNSCQHMAIKWTICIRQFPQHASYIHDSEHYPSTGNFTSNKK